MAGGRIIFLCLLLVLLGTVVYFRVLPHKDALEHSMLPGAGDARGKFSNNALLDDGSFNPVSPLKLVRRKASDPPLTIDAAAIVAADDWRSRYEPFVKSLRPDPASPGFYVYTFLDRTPAGVGPHFTYGWHLLGSAALACWTNARLAGAEPPEHYGLPSPGAALEAAGDAPPTLDAWALKALNDPATREARYIVIGAYDFIPKTGLYTFEMRLLDRQKPDDARGITLASTQAAGRPDFYTMTQLQAKMAKQLAERLIQLGVCRRHPEFAAHGLEFDHELRAVAALFDAGDSWAVMEGIDRSLELATLFPGASAPLQAASYGMNELNYMMFIYPESEPNCYASDYALRAFALTQLAAALDQRPVMTLLNRMASEGWVSRTAEQIPALPVQVSCGAVPPELAAYQGAAAGEVKPNSDLLYSQAVPEWLVLRLEHDQTARYGWSPYRDYFEARLDDWETRDFSRQARLRSLSDWHYPDAQGLSAASGYIRGATMMMQGQVADDFAALLASESRGSAASRLLGDAAAVLRIPDQRLVAPAGAGDYYALRKLLANTSMRLWNEPNNPQHGYFQALAAAQRAAAAVRASPALTRSGSGYLGLEFTPAERIKFYSRADQISPRLVAQNVACSSPQYAFVAPYMQQYLNEFPANAAAQCDFVSLIRDTRQSGPKAIAGLNSAAMRAVEAFPLSEKAWTDLALGALAAGEPQEAARLRALARRLNPDYLVPSVTAMAARPTPADVAAIALPADVALSY